MVKRFPFEFNEFHGLDPKSNNSLDIEPLLAEEYAGEITTNFTISVKNGSNQFASSIEGFIDYGQLLLFVVFFYLTVKWIVFVTCRSN